MPRAEAARPRSRACPAGIVPLASGRWRVRCILASMSRSWTMLRMVLPLMVSSRLPASSRRTAVLSAGHLALM